MGIAERREREKEELRTRIIEAARDIVSAEGLDALSMRAIAERIEYSPATIYLHFEGKDDLLRSVVESGFGRLDGEMNRAIERAGPEANALERYRALGRAYARFALDNTAYFRVMFELPTVASLEECPEPPEGERGGQFVVDLLVEAREAGLLAIPDPEQAAVIGWGLIHGLTSLFLGGHLRDEVPAREEFEALIEQAMRSLHIGWSPESSGGEAEAGLKGGDA